TATVATPWRHSSVASATSNTASGWAECNHTHRSCWSAGMQVPSGPSRVSNGPTPSGSHLGAMRAHSSLPRPTTMLTPAIVVACSRMRCSAPSTSGAGASGATSKCRWWWDRVPTAKIPSWSVGRMAVIQPRVAHRARRRPARPEVGPGGRRGGVAAVGRAAGSGPLLVVLLQDGGHLELEGDLLAHEHATGLERRVPGEAPVLAVDDHAALEPEAGVAEGVDGGARVLEVEGDRAGRALDGEVAGHPVGRVVHHLDRGAAELDGRVVLHVEEVVAAQVRVAVGVAGVDAGGLDGDRQVGPRRVLG